MFSEFAVLFSVVEVALEALEDGVVSGSVGELLEFSDLTESGVTDAGSSGFCVCFDESADLCCCCGPLFFVSDSSSSSSSSESVSKFDLPSGLAG